MSSDRIQPAGSLKARLPDITWQYPSLPVWLARRLLRASETVAWVRGPRWNPWWERLVTHPGLFLLALAVGAVCVSSWRLLNGSWSGMPAALILTAAGIVLGSIYVLAIFNAYFTRLVVTNLRLLILQGHEVCRSWSIDNLPRSLLRYGRRGDENPTVNVDALQTMLGGASDQFADPKTIQALGKNLERIRASENRGR